VEVVGGPRIDGQFVHLGVVETRFVEQLRVGLFEQLQPQFHHLAVRTGDHTDATEVNRQRANFLVRVEVGLRAGFQECNRAVADEVVERRHTAGGVERVGGRTVGQRHLAAAGEEEGREQAGVGLVGEQVGVVGAVRRRHRFEGEGDHLAGLGHVLERGRAGLLQVVARGRQPAADGPPRGWVVEVE
jgi:hypothetical protein